MILMFSSLSKASISTATFLCRVCAFDNLDGLTSLFYYNELLRMETEKGVILEDCHIDKGDQGMELSYIFELFHKVIDTGSSACCTFGTPGW